MPTTRDAVEPTLALSIDHLPAAWRTCLDEIPGVEADPLADSGWRAFVPARDPAGLAPEMAPILAAARTLGCWWVTFDLGADPVSDLPVYPHPDVEVSRFEELVLADIAALPGGA